MHLQTPPVSRPRYHWGVRCFHQLDVDSVETKPRGLDGRQLSGKITWPALISSWVMAQKERIPFSG